MSNQEEIAKIKIIQNIIDFPELLGLHLTTLTIDDKLFILKNMSDDEYHLLLINSLPNVISWEFIAKFAKYTNEYEELIKKISPNTWQINTWSMFSKMAKNIPKEYHKDLIKHMPDKFPELKYIEICPKLVHEINLDNYDIDTKDKIYKIIAMEHEVELFKKLFPIYDPDYHNLFEEIIEYDPNQVKFWWNNLPSSELTNLIAYAIKFNSSLLQDKDLPKYIFCNTHNVLNILDRLKILLVIMFVSLMLITNFILPDIESLLIFNLTSFVYLFIANLIIVVLQEYFNAKKITTNSQINSE